MKLFKSRKTYYLYNPNTLSYERVYPSAKDRFFGVLRHLSIGIVIGVGIFFSNATRTYTGRSSRRNRSPNPSASPVSAGPTGMNT